MNFIKNNIIIIILIAVAIIGVLLFRSCGHSSVAPIIKTDTVRTTFNKVDTTYDTITVKYTTYVPVIGKTTKPTKARLDTTGELPKTLPDAVKVIDTLKDKYYSYHAYYDSISFDTLGHLGYLEINDLVTENKIIARTPIAHFRIPTIHDTVTQSTTITNNITTPKRQVYIGGEITAIKTIPNGAMLGLMYKDRQDRVISAKYGYTDIGGKVYPQFAAGLYFKIKLHK